LSGGGEKAEGHRKRNTARGRIRIEAPIQKESEEGESQKKYSGNRWSLDKTTKEREDTRETRKECRETGEDPEVG